MKASKILLFGGILLFAVSCERGSNFPDQPKISFTKYQYSSEGGSDILKVLFSFTDGDGNFGIRDNERDSWPPAGIDSIYKDNLLVDYYEKNNGQYQLREDVDLNAQLPFIQPKGQNKSLKANFTFRFDATLRGSDTVRFDIRVVDRSFNVSNTIMTPEFVFP